MTAALDADLLDMVAKVVDAFCWQPQGPRVAGLAVLGLPRIADGLRASETLAAIDRDHQPVRWAPDSPTVVCISGCGAWPCKTRRRLDGEP